MNDISAKIVHWYDKNKRDLPWRHTQDAYRIWLSEIILQQTRVVQGMDYYLRFVERYPTVTDLANADEDEVLKMWQGLGYYSRARNLYVAAKSIAEKGAFPTDYPSVRALKGIGDYTLIDADPVNLAKYYASKNKFVSTSSRFLAIIASFNFL